MKSPSPPVIEISMITSGKINRTHQQIYLPLSLHALSGKTKSKSKKKEKEKEKKKIVFFGESEEIQRETKTNRGNKTKRKRRDEIERELVVFFVVSLWFI